eukprot:11020597-Lingulodinium_polyedra.AAC.1
MTAQSCPLELRDDASEHALRCANAARPAQTRTTRTPTAGQRGACDFQRQHARDALPRRNPGTH